MPWNVGINSETGECCGCDVDTPPCFDCKEKEPPKENCDCNKIGLYNSPSYCENKLPPDERPCFKCIFIDNCNDLIPDTAGSQGCYGNPTLKTCKEIDCRDASAGPPDPASCTKEGPCGSCQTFGLNCFKDVPKECSDFGFLSEDGAYTQCTASGASKADTGFCSNVESTGCSGLLCYSCKDCSDFGYKSSCGAGEDPVPIKDTSIKDRCGLECFNCVPASCNCTDYGLLNAPKYTACSDVNTSYPFPAGSPCENKPCYQEKCKTCEDYGLLSERPPTEDIPECKKLDRETKQICFDLGDCFDVSCYKYRDTTCKDCKSASGGSNCASEPGDCDPDQWFDPNGECDSCEDSNGNECIEEVGPCDGVCKEYCGFTVISIGTPQVQGTPSCSTTANLTFNFGCKAGDADSVAKSQITGTFSVNCPAGSDPCVSKTDNWSDATGGGAGNKSNPTSVIDFYYEDCSISPADLLIPVTLQRCEECT